VAIILEREPLSIAHLRLRSSEGTAKHKEPQLCAECCRM